MERQPESRKKTILILLPFLNEEKLILDALEDLREGIYGHNRAQEDKNPQTWSCQFEVQLCDSGSIDGSLEIATSFCEKFALPWFIQSYPTATNLSDLLFQALMEKPDYNYYWIVPADLRIHRAAFNTIAKHLAEPVDHKLLAFQKYYIEASILMQIYSLGLNLLAKTLGFFVWTNALMIRADFFKHQLASAGGFLDDLRMARQAFRSQSYKLFLNPKVGVSARRYKARGFLRQLSINFRVLWGFYVEKKDTQELKKIYEKNGSN